MILLHQHRFGVATYHRKVDPEHAGQSYAQGLVVPVEVRFQHWMNGRPSQADAFLDAGADETLISFRWLTDRSRDSDFQGTLPLNNPSGYIEEDVEISVSEQRLNLGGPDQPVWIGAQDDDPVDFAIMPGCEDILLGRDFITQHGLLLLIDGEERSLSLLMPSDADNLRRRTHIRQAFDPKRRT